MKEDYVDKKTMAAQKIQADECIIATPEADAV
jgi:hypothetical protein